MLGFKAGFFGGVFFVTAAAFAFVVIQLRIGSPDHTVACITHTKAKIDIVERHGKRFVHSAHLVKHAGFHQKAGSSHAGKILHGGRAEHIAASAAIFVFVAVARIAAQARDNARMLNGVIGIIEHSAADGCPGAAGLHEHFGEPVGVDDLHIVIQHQQIFTPGVCAAKIIDA